MKRYSLAFLTLILVPFLILQSCKKLNQPTELGGNLLPGVDNIHTFETFLGTQTNNAPFYDTTRTSTSDFAAIGALNDPEFGQTNASLYFNLSSSVYGSYPFKVDRQNVNDPNYLSIDSMVLSLSYNGAYGDSNAPQTVHVFEIAQDPTFSDTVFNTFTRPDINTTGSELGSTTFIPSSLKDSVPEVLKVGDTVRNANIIRIRFNNNSLGQRLAGYDTIPGSPNGGFASDSIFRTLFRGLAIKSDNASGSGNLSYIKIGDTKNTRLTIYFRSLRNGVKDTTALNFVHLVNGQANVIVRTPSGNYANYLANGPGQDDKIYLQSTPGSYAAIKIPGLDTFGNKVIHRAELIATVLPSALSNIFTPPARLILDRINSTHDTAFMLQNDLVASTATGSLSIDYATFGGNLMTDNTYRFNISRYVQSIVTKHEHNDSLRIYAPVRTILRNTNLGQFISVPVLNAVGEGRVILGGGNFSDPALRLRLRIIYSDL